MAWICFLAIIGEMVVSLGCEPRGFVFERKGGEAAEQEAEDEEEEPEANGAEKLRSGFERGCHVGNRS